LAGADTVVFVEDDDPRARKIVEGKIVEDASIIHYFKNGRWFEATC